MPVPTSGLRVTDKAWPSISNSGSSNEEGYVSASQTGTEGRSAISYSKQVQMACDSYPGKHPHTRRLQEDMSAWIASFKKSIAIADQIGESNLQPTQRYADGRRSTRTTLLRPSVTNNPLYQSSPPRAAYFEEQRLPWNAGYVQPGSPSTSFQRSISPPGGRNQTKMSISRESSPSTNDYSPQDQVGRKQRLASLQTEVCHKGYLPSRLISRFRIRININVLEAVLLGASCRHPP